MIVKFFLRQAVVEWMVPEPKREGFNFIGLCKNIRADGHFISEDIYIPHSEIVAIGFGTAQQVMMQPAGTAPSTETKQ